MTLNKQCIKDILHYVIDNSEIDYNEVKAGYKSISLPSIVKALSKDEKYSEEVILHSFLYALRIGMFFSDSRLDFKGFTLVAVLVQDVSPIGYKFLEDEKIY